MLKRSIWILLLFASVAWPAAAFAGSGEQRVALRRAVAASAERLVAELPASAKVKAHAVERVLLVVGPRGPQARGVHAALSDALTGLDGFSVVWPNPGIDSFVDLVFLHPSEPRYDRETVLRLGGTFRAAQGVLFATWRFEEGVKGGTRVAVSMELWDARTAEKIWGGAHAEVFDLALLEGINGLIDAGRIDEALAHIGAVITANPEWRTELELARTRASKLKAHTMELALIQGAVDQSNVKETLERLRTLYGQGDPALRDALWGLRTDIHAKLLAPIEALLDGRNAAEAQARIQQLAEDHAGDLDLEVALARLKGRLVALTDERARQLTATEGDLRMLYGVAGLLAVFLLGAFFRIALRKRARVARRNLGLDALESEAAQANRVKEVLHRDRDIRARMLRDLDRAEDALAEAHHKAQARERLSVAQGVHAASEHLQELRRRVKLVQDGDPQDFLKGRLPKTNLEGLLASMPALAGQMQEFSKEAMAAQDSVTSGGDPAKNLRLLGGIALRVQGKLAEREVFFRKMA